MTLAYAKIVLYSRGLTPEQVLVGWGGAGPCGTAERYMSCARQARAFAASYAQGLLDASRENGLAIPASAYQDTTEIAQLEQAAQAWETLAEAASR